MGRRGRIKGGRIEGVEAEGAESEGRSPRAEMEGENKRGGRVVMLLYRTGGVGGGGVEVQ